MSEVLGPLAGLEGIWEGEKGTDTAPDDDPTQQEINKYRERMTFAADWRWSRTTSRSSTGSATRPPPGG